MIGFIGFGEAAFHIAKGLRGAGAPALLGYDIHHRTPARGELIRSRASQAGAVLVDSPAELAGRCDVLLSLVTADRAAEAAHQNRPHLHPRHLYADLNSVSPALKEAIGKEISASAARYVEGAIMSPVPPKGHKVPIVVNGPFANDFIGAMGRYGMHLDAMNGEAGAAAAVKMCRSIVVKGMEAILLECLLASTRYGVGERVFGSLDESFPGFQWRDQAWYMAGRVFEHGERRAREMDEVAAMLRAAGIEPVMAEATARMQDWRAGAGPANSVEEMVALLSREKQ